MHTITKYPITRDNFSFKTWIDEWDDPTTLDEINEYIDKIIEKAEWLRQKFLETENKMYWRLLIETLPDGWMQKRTITLNYQVLRNMYFARRHHRQQWWKDFCKFIETLPYAIELICFDRSKYSLGYLKIEE